MAMTLEIEQTIIGMCLAKSSNVAEAFAMGLSADYFSSEALGSSFLACVDLWGAAKSVDVPSVARYVGVEHQTMLRELRNNAPPTQNFAPYVRALIDARRSMRAMVALAEASHAFTNRRPMDPIEPTLHRLAEAMAAIQGQGSAIETTPMREAIDKALAAIEKRMVSPEFISTGFPQLDLEIYGWQPGGMYVLGARTGLGKTTLATNFAMTAAHGGYRTAFVTVEMSAVEITEKLIAQECRVRHLRLRNGKLDDSDLDRLDLAHKMTDLPIDIVKVKQASLAHLESEIMRLVRACGTKLVIIDYLQLFEIDDGQRRTSREEAKTVSSRLKQLAMRLNVPILVLSQLNRQTPEYEEPGLHNIAESDQIGRDADVVLFIYCDNAGNHFLTTAKNRHGKDGSMKIDADLDHSRFGVKM
jgi:replicative DNA helicase